MLTLSRVIKLNSGGIEQDVSGVKWIVPAGVDVNQDITQGKGRHLSASPFRSSSSEANGSISNIHFL